MSGTGNGTERTEIFSALRESTRVITEVTNELVELQEKVEDLEEEMKTINAHLDNIARESAITNDLLRQDIDQRKRKEADEKEEKKQSAQDRKQLLMKIGNGAWELLNKPVSMFLMAAVAYFVYHTFPIPAALPVNIAPDIVDVAPDGASLDP